MGKQAIMNILNKVDNFHEMVLSLNIDEFLIDKGEDISLIDKGQKIEFTLEYLDKSLKEDFVRLEMCLKKGVCLGCEEERSEVVNLPCRCGLFCLKCVHWFLSKQKCWCVICMMNISNLQFVGEDKIINVSTYTKDLDMNIYNQICLKENCCFCCCKGTLEVSNMPCAHKFWCRDCISSFLTKGRPDCILCGVEVEGFIYQDKNYTFIFKEGKDKGHDFLNRKLISELGLQFVNEREVLAAFFDPCRKGLCLNCNKMEANFVNVPCNCKIFCEKCNELYFCSVDAYTGRRECCRSVVPKQCCKVIEKCKCLVCGEKVKNTKRVEVSSVKQENNHLLEFLVTKPRKIKRKHVKEE